MLILIRKKNEKVQGESLHFVLLEQVTTHLVKPQTCLTLSSLVSTRKMFFITADKAEYGAGAVWNAFSAKRIFSFWCC